jgi:hypothetical protein
MKILVCDVCKTKMSEPVVGRNYFHVAHRDICESCKDELERHIKPIIRTKAPFDYQWYDSLVKDSIENAMQKGKF